MSVAFTKVTGGKSGCNKLEEKSGDDFGLFMGFLFLDQVLGIWCKLICVSVELPFPLSDNLSFNVNYNPQLSNWKMFRRNRIKIRSERAVACDCSHMKMPLLNQRFGPSSTLNWTIGTLHYVHCTKWQECSRVSQGTFRVLPKDVGGYLNIFCLERLYHWATVYFYFKATGWFHFSGILCCYCFQKLGRDVMLWQHHKNILRYVKDQ